MFFPNNVNAHTSSCDGGSESRGWIVHCDSHAGTTSYNYRFEYGLSSEYKGYTYTGVARWNNISIVYVSYSSSSDNLVTSYGGPDSSTAAYTKSWVYSTGHKARWEIGYNRYVMGNRSSTQNNSTGAHEMGHTIGLADLDYSYNSKKLMYGFGTRTEHYPTSYDKTGAREGVKFY